MNHLSELDQGLFQFIAGAYKLLLYLAFNYNLFKRGNMMEKISVVQAVMSTLPHPVALLTSVDAEGKANVMTISWYTFASLKPPTAVFCVSNKSYTNSLISKSGSFSLSLPTSKLSEKTLLAGKSHGFDMDKINDIGFEVEDHNGFIAPIIKGSAVAFSLKLLDKMDASDHTVFLAEIVAAVKDNDKKHIYAFDGYTDLHEL
jgi:flavin reductase (DIM6/NTAB) family NADH-FMN oxidoreductase RutF